MKALSKSSSAHILLALLLCLIMSTSGCRIFFSGSRANPLEEAESLIARGDIDAAIRAYEGHIRARLAMAERPSWENPYFYHLIIGDLELKRDRLPAAIEHYDLAAHNGVDPGLISDRYRGVALYLEERGQFAQALEFLAPHRELDPILINSMLDRISKALTAQEEANAEEQARPKSSETPAAQPSPLAATPGWGVG